MSDSPPYSYSGDSMNHRHLLPDEIDLLLDDEVGFGVPPLRAHLGECGECRARVEDARMAVDALEAVPHFAPTHTFADKVMSQVPVFVPWHVTARDTVARWLPQSRPARVAVAMLATSAASIMTVAILWIATQTDVLVLASGAAGDRVRSWSSMQAVWSFPRCSGTRCSGSSRAPEPSGSAAAARTRRGNSRSIAGLRSLALASSRRRA